MARGGIRRFDVQAKWAVICSLVAIMPVLLVAAAEFRNFDRQMSVIVYKSAGKTHLGILACTAAAVLLSLSGIILGFNSAGQRRNQKQKQSWLGFFLGAAALCGAIVLFSAFMILKLAVM